MVLIFSVRLSPKHSLAVRRLIVNKLASHQIPSLYISIEIGLMHTIKLLNNEWWIIVLEDLVQRGCSRLPESLKVFHRWLLLLGYLRIDSVIWPVIFFSGCKAMILQESFLLLSHRLKLFVSIYDFGLANERQSRGKILQLMLRLSQMQNLGDSGPIF